jgi:hypothetical protein
VRASERGSVSQTIDGTVVEVSYGRPALRGRTAFGGVVHWGEVWTPGANFSTTLRVSRPVRLGQQSVPAGIYSVWVVPTPEAWTMHLHRNAKLYHLERPKVAEMAFSTPMTVGEASAVERLTFSFPDVRRDGATLRLQWGSTTAAVELTVPSTAAARRVMTRRQAEPFLGQYRGWVFAENGDSVELRHRLTFEDGRLTGAIEGSARTFELVPAGKPREFWFEWHDAGGPIDQERASPVEFIVDRRGRVTGYRMRGIEQPLWMRSVRVAD